jgi:predicted enzyme related to lactoylglutathione lyase
MLHMQNRNLFSAIVIFLLLISLLISIFNIKFWKQEGQVIKWDVLEYYGYLPSAFIYKDEMPGPGKYHIYGDGSTELGGIFTPPAGYPLPPHFLYYVHVTDLDAASERVKKGGGEVWMGPMPIPGGDRITQFKDPQGAVFALHGK